MKPGDTVRHAPTGEDWVVCCVDGDELIPAGWPLTYAKLVDCTVIETCSDEASTDWIRRMARMPDKSDPRRRYAIALLEADHD